MPYPQVPNFTELIERITEYSRLKHEYGATGILPLLSEAEEALKTALTRIKALPEDIAIGNAKNLIN